jgi:hypothetical protein
VLPSKVAKHLYISGSSSTSFSTSGPFIFIVRRSPSLSVGDTSVWTKMHIVCQQSSRPYFLLFQIVAVRRMGSTCAVGLAFSSRSIHDLCLDPSARALIVSSRFSVRKTRLRIVFVFPQETMSRTRLVLIQLLIGQSWFCDSRRHWFECSKLFLCSIGLVPVSTHTRISL